MKTEFLIAALAVVLFSAGDSFAAAWGKSGRWCWFVAMLVAGNVAWVLFAVLNRTMPLASVSGVVSLGLVLGSILFGWLVFKEKLQPLEIAAIVVGVVSLALFAYARATAHAIPPETPT